MREEPWSKFFWADYDSDEGLRLCSLAAQGLWMRMLCLMARATPKGELRVGGKPCSAQDLAKSVSESDETVQRLLNELQDRGVYSASRAGVIYCRRMRKDAEISRKRAENGKKGAIATNGKQTGSEFCRGKNPANASAKVRLQKPEARSQSPEDNRRESYSPPQPARAPPSDDAVVKLRLAISDAYRAGGRQIPPDTGRAAVWLAQGYSAELCLAVIRERMPHAADKSLNWFDPAIADAFKKRPVAKPSEPAVETFDIGVGGLKIPVKNLEKAIHAWRENPQTWIWMWGPEPPKHPKIRDFAVERGIPLDREAAE